MVLDLQNLYKLAMLSAPKTPGGVCLFSYRKELMVPARRQKKLSA